jgi:hypothetical protein
MKRYLSTLLILLSLFSVQGWAEGGRTLLLADSEALLEGATDYLSGIIKVVPSTMESDYISRNWITGEGNKIHFDDLLHRKSLQGVSAIQGLQEEYNPDTISLIWLEREKVHEYKSYGIKKRDLKIRLRIIDPLSGRTVVDRAITYQPKFNTEPSDKTEREDARKALLAKAVSEFDLERLGSSLTRYLDDLQTSANKIRVVIQGIDQKEYFDWRDRLLSMVDSAGMKSGVRDHFDDVKETLTIRGDAMKGAPEFFRSLYHSTVESEILDNFDIRRTGKLIVLKVIPADTKRLVITGLSSQHYHNRLSIYQSALEAIGGVRKVEHHFVAGESDIDSRLVLSFLSTEDLPVVENQLWRSLRSTGKVPNRELVSISEKVIQYRIGEAENDMKSVVVMINNIAPGDYRDIGAEMDKIIKDLGVTGLKKSYSREDFQLKYDFNTMDRTVDVDTIIWGKINALSSLEDIVQDSSAGGMLGYFLNHDRAEKRQITVSISHVSPSDYGKAGRMLITTVKQIEGVEKFSYDYSEAEQVINMTFLYQGENAYSIDGEIWERVKTNADLSGLTTGQIDESSLEYLFGSNKKANNDRVVVSIKGVNGSDYKHVSTAFTKILRSANDVQNVRYGYSVKKRTITFRIEYSGDGLFALEDAIQLGMIKNELFKDVEKGEETGGRLIYHFRKMEGEDDEDGEETYLFNNQPSNNTASLVERLDKSVVYILVDGEKSSSEGTGFFVTQSGHIVTNAHVVSGAQGLYVRTLEDGKYRAEVIDTNERLDIALIRLVTNKKNFPAVKIGNSDKVKKGESILMIGNPLGIDYKHTVLTGIISGFNRHEGAMQLSIPSYPGSSGSPVFDRKGRVVGVMKARALTEKSKIVEVEKKAVMLTTHEAVENIGLIIPINYVRPMLEMVR